MHAHTLSHATHKANKSALGYIIVAFIILDDTQTYSNKACYVLAIAIVTFFNDTMYVYTIIIC